MNGHDNILEVRELEKKFPAHSPLFGQPKSFVHAISGIELAIQRGETLGLVGESGCGKSTLARLILGLEEPSNGQIFFEGKSINQKDRNLLRSLRRQIQIIFQDPYSSLNPRKTVGKIIETPLIVHKIGNKQKRAERVLQLIEMVGLRPEHISRYPHEFSGGQRQRIGIARALALNPKFIVADEPVSALDVSIQAQVLNLLQDLQNEFNLTYLFIAHDLSVVKHVSDRVAVMHLGRIAELADNQSIFRDPKHPYTLALLSAIPIPDPELIRKRTTLVGEVPSPINPPTGCNFHTRCGKSLKICAAEIPQLRLVAPGHWVACHLHSQGVILESL